MRNKLLWLAIVTGLLLLAFSLLGCGSPKVVLHPITPDDIFSIPKGAQVEWSDMTIDGKEVPGDIVFIKKMGWFVSDYYMKEVMKAKVE